VPAGNSKLDPAIVAEVSTLGREIICLDDAADQAATAVRERKEQMRNRLRELEVRHVNGDGVVITWSQIKGRTTIALEQLRADLGDLSKYEKIGAPSDRLTIKPSI
jgi:hypothetical protein